MTILVWVLVILLAVALTFCQQYWWDRLTAREERDQALREMTTLGSQARVALALVDTANDSRDFAQHQVALLTATLRDYEEAETMRIAAERQERP